MTTTTATTTTAPALTPFAADPRIAELGSGYRALCRTGNMTEANMRLAYLEGYLEARLGRPATTEELSAALPPF